MKRRQARRGMNPASDCVRVVTESNNTSSALATEVDSRRLFAAVLRDASAPAQATVAA